MANYREIIKMAEEKAKKAADALREKKAARGPDLAGIAAFKAKEARKEAEKNHRLQTERENLLALRANNSKSMRRTKVMASRTKDNDFSTMRVTEDDIVNRAKVDRKVSRVGFADKKERLKMKLQMDDSLDKLTKRDRDKVLKKLEKDEPIKVDRGAPKDKFDAYIKKTLEAKKTGTPEKVRRPPPPPQPFSYSELLKQAEEKSTKKISLEQLIDSQLEEKEKIYRPLTQKEKEREREERYYKSRADKATLKPKVEPKPAPHAESKPAYPKLPPPRPPKPISAPRFPSMSQSIKNVPPPPPASKFKLPPRPRSPEPAYQPGLVPKSNAQSPVNKHLPGPSRNLKQPPPKQPPSVKTNKSQYIPSSISNKGRPEPYVPRQQAYSPPQYRPKAKLPPIGRNYFRGKYVEEYNQEEGEDYDDYDEEDDEMDDFIDDGVISEEEDVSAAIRNIFGYDKRKYRYVDDDDDIEESSYADVMKEEKHSLREGIREDLEDIEREEDEKRKRKEKLKQLVKAKKMKSRF